MGVPALFRWLSRKYPKIVLPVVEEQPTLVPGRDGGMSEIPVDMSKPNPNGSENDCLYLDMNGIVHPCTHPEGKPAPKTEEDMMVEVFKYTERVVNMARPRKVLLMAIDGVAPRAKMNQQRSRRFRSAEEAKTKAKEKEEAIKEWEAMGKTLTDEYKNEKAWDSNAITPGTPFMDLLASSLRYWVAYKMNTDPGWANLQVIISDASVPGEGEHKIMDFVRRQRSQPGYDPNTTHVFYGLDADLIMLSLATHEPNFKILREDVFAQAAKRGCHKCGQPGHHSANCLGLPPEKKNEAEVSAKTSPLKPFIFLDVSILREYLQVELNVPGLPFAFDLERAIDDWVFMIFFVGNDFLPHLPSLDIREGAIDMLLKIWRASLPQMGGYLTDNGRVDLPRAQHIMDGLAAREDDIFRKRRETEQRQDAIDKEKRKRIEAQQNRGQTENTHSMRNGVNYVPVLTETAQAATPESADKSAAATPAHSTQPATAAMSPLALPVKPASVVPPAVSPPLTSSAPPKPKNPMFLSSSRPRGNAPIRGGFVNPNGPGALSAASAATSSGSDVSAMLGSGKDVVANRAAIRKANLSAAEMLRAELLAGKVSPTTAAETVGQKQETREDDPTALSATASEQETEKGASTVAVGAESETTATSASSAVVEAVETEVAEEADGTKDAIITSPPAAASDVEEDIPASAVNGQGTALAADTDTEMADTKEADSGRGKKRSADEADIPGTRDEAEEEEKSFAKSEADATLLKEELLDEDEESETSESESSDSDTTGPLKPHKPKPLKMLGNNMVEQEDTVQLWEPGYKERYYEQKFGVKLDDVQFRRSCAKSYVEGLSWVLAYYYNGCPSWTWYYPHHFAPFASDFTDLASMDINFEKGAPFKPFEQLMGVFPAASRFHIPTAFQGLMIEEDSEIIDFYPEEFSIDMNGKKMLWQGVALLPFIDQERLLSALAKRYPELTEDEVRRNTFGHDVIFVNEDNPLYDQIASLYMKRKVDKPVPVDASLSKGVHGTILPDEGCVPNSTYTSPLKDQNLSDIEGDRSISAYWWMPEQRVQHKSVLLPGYKPKRRVLTPEDIDGIHRSVNGEERNFRRGAAGDGFHAQRRALEGPGMVRRDARNGYDNRRSSGGGYSDSRQGNYGAPSHAGSDYDRRTNGSYGGHGGGGSSYDNRGPYSGYSAGSGPPSSGYGGRGQQAYGAGAGGRSAPASNSYAGSGYGYGTPPSRSHAPTPPAAANYGGYGGSGAPHYGSYGQQPPAGRYQAPPAAAPSGPPGSSSYGSYGQAGYSASAVPYSSGYGYNPPGQAPTAAGSGSHYGGYGGGYGGAPAPAHPYPGQPPRHQQPGGYGGYGASSGGAGYYTPPPSSGPAGYSNRSAILPAHLRNGPPGGGGPPPPTPQSSHQRWSR